MKVIITLLVLLVLPFYGQAQYNGGSFDGETNAATFGVRLNGSIASFSVLYRSGNGDGYNQQTANALLNGNALTLYNGGLGDGYATNLNSETLSGFDTALLYQGNDGDGYSQFVSNVTNLQGENISTLYNGNEGDGFAVNFLADVLLQGFMTNLYEGGIGDGYTQALLPDVLLIGFMTELYNGGDGDGFSSLVSSGNLINGLLIAFFSGGDGDGFATDSLNTSITLDVIDQLVKLNVLLYPNPASRIVTINPGDGVSIESVKLYDVTGKLMPINLSNTNTLDVSHLADGIYLLSIYSINGSVTKRLIVKK